MKEIVHETCVRAKSLILPKLESGIEVDAYNEKGKIGTLCVDRGGISWTTKHKKYEKRLSWTDFDLMIRDYFGELDY